MTELLHWLRPWYPSWWLCAALALAAGLYLRGCRRRHTPRWRQALFWLGWLLSWQGLQTQWDYLAEHEFFVHMIQQATLHDFAPLLVMAAWPGPALRAGLPAALRQRWLLPLARWAPLRMAAAVLLNPWVATLVFSGIVVFWLVPLVHVGVMLNTTLYQWMNATMIADGLLFWWLVLDPRTSGPAHVRAGLRIFLPLLAMLPQMLIGAVLALAASDWYPIYSLCGRAIAGVSALQDQQLGGLILWIPASAANVVAALVALRNWTRLSARKRLEPAS
ncbi:MAG: cytochrome c oxidase assembly protein [Burkholderiales bacterium]|nr:cytochrome c oxidase assembly protein [Burkholderiales bacterium]